MSNSSYPHRISVAPMMERTDRHCRLLLRLIAPHVWLYTEMITARALVRGDRARLLRFDAREHPVALQLGGSEPGELAEAARLGAEAGYDEINLNVGCPSGRVQAACFGAALMREPERVAECVAAMRAAVPVPVTVKTRLGVDNHDGYDFLHEFVDTVVAAGCRTLLVHARKAWLSGLSPKENREIPPLDYTRVYRLKRDFRDVEIVVNGGLTDAGAISAQLEQVDGAMIGRAAYDNPMLMAELDPLALVGASAFVGASFVRDAVGPSFARDAVGASFARDAVGASFARDSLEDRERSSLPQQDIVARLRSHTRASVLREYAVYMQAELRGGTPLKSMTRHLMGMYTGERGGRFWRRSLSLMPDGAVGLDALKALAANLEEHQEIASEARSHNSHDRSAMQVFQPR